MRESANAASESGRKFPKHPPGWTLLRALKTVISQGSELMPTASGGRDLYYRSMIERGGREGGMMFLLRWIFESYMAHGTCEDTHFVWARMPFPVASSESGRKKGEHNGLKRLVRPIVNG